MQIKNDLVDSSIIFEILKNEDLDHFLQSNIETDNDCLNNDYANFRDSLEKITRSDLLNMVKSKYSISSASVIRTFNKPKRDEAVIFLRNNGLSIRQIEKLTGVSRGITQKIILRNK